MDWTILQPQSGARYSLDPDPDLPDHGRWLSLQANSDAARWESTSLSIELRNGKPVARMSRGRHRIDAVDPRCHIRRRVVIEVEAL